jgi:transposase
VTGVILKKDMRHILTDYIHTLTNAEAEGMNNRVQSLIAKASGYRNRERFKRAILLHAGGLQLYPFGLQ